MDKKLIASFGLVSALTLHQISPEIVNQLVAGLSLVQLATLMINGSVLIDLLKFEGWKEKLPFYLIKCEKHGYQLSYPSGYMKSLLCPKCIENQTSQS
jgi:hypothetical protein